MSAIKRTVLFACLVALVAGGPSAQPSDDTAVGEQLPAHLRAHLIEEMQAVLAASQQILDALVRGDHQRVAAQAQSIHDSFILAQQLTEEEHEALHAALPSAFIERDHAFHELSARLADAARAKDVTQQHRLFSNLLEACLECHTAHARNRFPQLAGSASR